MREYEAHVYTRTVAAWRVSFTDPSGIEHGVEVLAESLFEAAAQWSFARRAWRIIHRADNPITSSVLPLSAKAILTDVRATRELGPKWNLPKSARKVFRDRIVQMLDVTAGGQRLSFLLCTARWQDPRTPEHDS